MIRWAVWMLVCLGMVAAQQQQGGGAEEPRYGLSGVVVNSVTGEPVPRAKVELQPRMVRARSDAGGWIGKVQGRAVLTDGSGQFAFGDLEEGSYWVTPAKPGFFAATASGGTVPVRPGVMGVERTMVEVGEGKGGGVRLLLVPETVLAGRAVDEQGAPVAGLQVVAWSQQVLSGRKRWMQAGAANTDEDGEFRIADLRPNAYVLRYGPRMPESRFTRANDERGIGMGYWPGVPMRRAAGVIEGKAGQTEEVDLRLRQERLLRVQGEVVGIPAEAEGGANCRALDEEREDVTAGRHATDEQHFDLRVGGPGTYTIECRFYGQQQLQGEQTVQLRGDAVGMRIPLARLAQLPVNVTVQSKSEVGVPQFSLRSVTGGQDTYSQVNGKTKQTLFQQVEPGTYWLELSSGGEWYVASASFRGRDVLHEPVVIEAGTTGVFEVALRTDVARLALKVEGVQQGEQGGSVLVVDESRPELPHTWPLVEGTMSMPVAPGRYTVYAFGPEVVASVEWANPKALERYAGRAASFSVGAGEQKTVTVGVVREER